MNTHLAEARDEYDDEGDEAPSCPMCSGPGVPLGKLGNRQHYRCRNCGMDFSHEDEKTTPAPKPKKTNESADDDDDDDDDDEGTIEGNGYDDPEQLDDLEDVAQERADEDSETYVVAVSDDNEEARVMSSADFDENLDGEDDWRIVRKVTPSDDDNASDEDAIAAANENADSEESADESVVAELEKSEPVEEVKGDPDHEQARELTGYIHNNAGLYQRQHLPIIRNLMTKKARGVYDSNKAVKLFGYMADSGAKEYHKDHGDPNQPWHRSFNTATRHETAKNLHSHFEKEADVGNYDHLKPKKYMEGMETIEEAEGTKLKVVKRISRMGETLNTVHHPETGKILGLITHHESAKGQPVKAFAYDGGGMRFTANLAFLQEGWQAEGAGGDCQQVQGPVGIRAISAPGQ